MKPRQETRSRHRTERAEDNVRRNGSSKTKVLIAYVITERDEQKYWNRIGVAFINRDGSLNVKLEALPVSGELHLRERSERDDDWKGRDERRGRRDEREPDDKDIPF